MNLDAVDSFRMDHSQTLLQHLELSCNLQGSARAWIKAAANTQADAANDNRINAAHLNA